MRKLKIVLVAIAALEITPDQLMTGKKPKEVLFARYICIQILKEEKYSTSDILDVFAGWSRAYVNSHCTTSFDALIRYNRIFKDMYLTAVKAVEDMPDESENDKKSA